MILEILSLIAITICYLFTSFIVLKVMFDSEKYDNINKNIAKAIIFIIAIILIMLATYYIVVEWQYLIIMNKPVTL